MKSDLNSYGPVFRRLLETDRSRPLDFGESARGPDELRGLQPATAFGEAKIVDRDMASCCLAGVWLLYDCLDESHAISQGIHNASGSFWHGIMHRREGDYSNAKYWFRRVDLHPTFPSLAAAARELAAGDDSEVAREVADLGEWDPYRFVDLCQAAVRGRPVAEPLLRAIQQAEWELLFDHCYRQAIGG